MQLLVLASVLTVGLCMSGGYSEQDLTAPGIREKYMKQLGELQTLDLIWGDLDSLPQLTLLSVKTQVVSGMNYNFTVQWENKVCSIVYYEQSWTNTHKIESNSCIQQKRQFLAGGYATQNLNDPKWSTMLTNLSSGSNPLITLPAASNGYDLVSVRTQVVAGINYEFTLKIGQQTCMIVYYEVSWQNKHEITSDSCSALTSGKRQLPGGWSPVTDTSAAGVQSCLGASLDRINSRSNSMYRLVDTNIEHMEQQVVAGTKYRYTFQVGVSSCMNSGEMVGLTSVGCPVDANSQMEKLSYTGECVYQAWVNPPAHLMNLNRGSQDVTINQGDNGSKIKLLGGDKHDMLNHGKALLGVDIHDMLNHGKQFLGGDNHDLIQHGKDLLGGGTHDLVQHGKQLLGGDTHDFVKHGKQLLGQGTHDLVQHGKQILGGDNHDLVQHGKQILGGDNIDLVQHGKQLLGGGTHDLVQHGKQLLGGDTHDLVQHISRNLIGQDGHDQKLHGSQATEGEEDCSPTMFKKFQRNHNKLYRSEQAEAKRYKVFCDNMRMARKLQEVEQGTARYGPTKFADLTEAEFKQYVGKKWDINAMNSMRKADIPKGTAPDAFDWRDHGAVTPVKNQGSCGSCWAFSTTGNIEGQWAIKKKALVSLSEQELVDCDKLDEGCNGGLPSNAYKEIERLGGLETETEYSYKGEDEKCNFIKRDVKVYINDSVAISSNETEMASWLAENGPISIGINAFAMQFYMGGISYPWKLFCNPSELDHGVLIVGYGVQGSKPYWIVKNSWGPDWGEKGYYLVYRGAGVCGLNTMCTSSIVN